MKSFITVLSVFLVAMLPLSAQDFDGEAFLRPQNHCDSITIADRMDYGFVLDSVRKGTMLGLADLPQLLRDSLSLEVDGGWNLDTLTFNGVSKKKREALYDSPLDIELSMTIIPFEEGHYFLPPLAVQTISPEGVIDTLVFKGCEMDVVPIQLDTATFEIRDIKGQIRYPLTFRELVPWIGGIIALAAVVFALILLIRSRRKAAEAAEHRDPPYIVALRGLEAFRGDKYWAPDKQKILYSGITDTLRTYIEETFDINAEEMTTGDIFSALKDDGDISRDVFDETKALFELSDFVKFAKHTAGEEDNMHAIPTAVRFVTSTYQARMERESAADSSEEGGGEASES